MTRRVLSTAVQVRPPITDAELLAMALDGQSLSRRLPDESQMRDALARLTRDLDEMVRSRQAGADGWEVEPITPDNFTVTETAEGEVVLRGTLFMTRKD